MSLELIAPGQRKNNKFFLVRGRLEGKDIEVSTKTTDKGVALRFKVKLEQRMLSGISDARVTFHKAIDLYQSTHILHNNDVGHLARLKLAIRDKDLSIITQADIDKAAMELFPDKSPEWRNRAVYTPAIAVMNYAARNEWCALRKWSRPKMKQPETRAASDDAAKALINTTQGMEHLLVLWLFFHGTRIGGALAVEWERMDLERGTYDLYISKNREWRSFPIDARILHILRSIPDKKGLLFPWRERHDVYKWLRPLVKSLGVKFTPHMARHWLGKQLNKHGAPIRTIANALGHSSMSSTERYVSVDMETIRDLMDKVPTLGNELGKPSKV